MTHPANSAKQTMYPRWMWGVLCLALLFSAVSLASIAYKKWGALTPQADQSNAEETLQLILTQPNVINTNWLRTLDPLVKHVEGRIVWSQVMQQGVMEFVGLPNIAKNQHYQLWVYDLAGNDTRPIFALQFNHVKKGKMLIPFSPKQLIKAPLKFEILLKTMTDDMQAEITQPLLLAQP